MKKALVLMLALVMLFGTSSLTIAAIADGDSAESSMNGGSTNNGTAAGGSGGDSSGGSVVTGWCDIVYTEDGIVVTLTPNLEAVKAIDKEMITELYNVLVEAVKKVIIEDLIEQFTAGAGVQTFSARQTDISGINIENVWMTALKSYVTENYANEGETEEQAYINFLNAVIDDDGEVDALAEHICSLVSAAVISGAISREELPKADEIESLIAEKLDEFVDDYITTYVEGVVNTFLDEIHEMNKHSDNDNDGICDECDKNMSELTGRDNLSSAGKLVEDCIETFIEQSIEKHITQLKNGTTPSDADLYVWDAVSVFLKDKVVSIVDEYMAYLVGTNDSFSEDALHDYIKQYFDTSITGAVNAYLDNDTAGLNSLEQELVDYIDGYVETFIKSQIDKFIEIRVDEIKYEKLEGADKIDYDKNHRKYNKLTDAEKLVYSKIYDKVVGYVDGLIVGYLAFINNEGEDTLDDDVKAEIEKFIVNYFIDNYESNFNTYFAEYKSYKTGNSAIVPVMYNIIEDYVKAKVVDKVAQLFISSVEDAHNDISEKLDDILADYNAKIQELNTAIGDLNAALSKLGNAKEDLGNAKTELEDAKAALTTAIDELKNAKDTIISERNKLNGTETQSISELASVRTVGAGVETKLEDKLTDAAGKLNGAENSISEVKALINSVKSSLSEVDALFDTVTALVNDIDFLLGNVRAALSDLKTELDGLENDINTKLSEIDIDGFAFSSPDAEVSVKVSELEGYLNEREQKIKEDLEALGKTPDEIDAEIEEKVGEYKAQLADLKEALVKISDAKAEILDAESDLESNGDLSDANKKLATGAEELQKAKNKLAELEAQDNPIVKAEEMIASAKSDFEEKIAKYIDTLRDFGATDVYLSGDETVSELANKFNEAKADFDNEKADYESNEKNSAIYAAIVAKYGALTAADWTKIFAGAIPDAYADLTSNFEGFEISENAADYRDEFIGQNLDGSEFVKVEIPVDIYNDMLDDRDEDVAKEKRAPYVKKIIDYVVESESEDNSLLDEYLEDIDVSTIVTDEDLEELKDYLFPEGTDTLDIVKDVIEYLDSQKKLVAANTAHTDKNGDGICDGCGEPVSPNCPAHVDQDANGSCDNCGIALKEISILHDIIHSLNMYSVLDECLKALKTADGVCDSCGAAEEECECSEFVDIDEVDEFMAAVHDYFTGDIEQLHSLIVEVVATLENEKVVDPEHPEEDHNKLEKLIQMVIDEVLAEFDKEKENSNPDSVINGLIKDVLGIDKTVKEIYERVDVIAKIIAEHYAETLKSLENVSGPESYLELLKLIKDVQINGESVISFSENGIAVRIEAIKNLINDLPTPSEIAEMDDEDMFLSYDIAVFTSFGSTQFNLTLKLGGGYETVRRVAAIIAENISFSIGANNEIVLNVTVPAKFAELALRACKTDKIPETLKHKVFEAFSTSSDDAMALINNVTIEELFELLDYIDKHVDFDGILDSSYVSKFEKLDGLTYDEIKAKIKDYEKYYKRAISLLNRAYAFVPEELTDKTLVDLYRGDGVFSANVENREVDVYKLAYKAISKLTDEKTGEKYANLLASFLDDTTVNASASVSVEFKNVGKIEYCVGDTAIKVGFLPVGADIKHFSNMSEYNGNYINGWVYADNTPADKMPMGDVKVYACLQTVEAVITANVTIINNKITKTYDGEQIILTAAPKDAVPGATLTYQWYKGDAAISGATDATLTLVNVADSGDYRCEIVATVGSISYEPATTGVLTVTINKKSINLSTVLPEADSSWSGTSVEYDGTLKNVDVTAFEYPSDIISFVEIKDGSVESGTKAATYGITVKFALVDEANYKFASDVSEYLYQWVITPISVENFLTWTYTFDANGEYSGNNGIYTYGVTEGSVTTYYISVAVNEEYADILEISLDADGSVTEATEVGEYKVIVNVQLKNSDNLGDYVFDSVVEKLWYVVKRDINLYDYEWDYDADADYIYNGEEGHTVSLVGLPYDIAQIVKYENAFANNAGSLEEDAIAFLDPDSEKYEDVIANYNVICDTSSALHWEVDKKVATTEHSKLEIPTASEGWIDQNTGAIHYVYGMDIDVFVSNLVDDLHDDDVIEYRYYKKKLQTRSGSVDSSVWDGPYAGLPSGAGEYLVEAYINNDNYTSHEEGFSIRVPLVIEKKLLDLEAPEYKVVITDNELPYNHGNELVAELTIPVALQELIDNGIVSIDWDGNDLKGTAIDEYEVFVAVVLNSEHAANYELVAHTGDTVVGECTYSVPWSIVKAELQYGVDFEVEFDYVGNIEYSYTGATVDVERLLSYTVNGLPKDFFVVTYDGTEGLTKGEYTVYATVSLNSEYGDRYIFEDEEIEVLKWYIGHFDGNDDGMCDNCGACVRHTDADEDGKCDNCGACVSHVDKNEDGVCDNCNAVDFGKITWSADYPTYSGEELTYVGISVEKNAEILNKYFTVVYRVGNEFVTELKATDAGKYNAQLWSILPNASGERLYSYAIFTLDATEHEWEVKKAPLDIGDVTLEDSRVLVDGNAHKIELSGTLAEGLTVNYEATLGGIAVDYENITAPGAYTISAIISNGNANYETVVLTAILTILEKQVYETDDVTVIAGVLLPEEYVFNADSVIEDYASLDLSLIAGNRKIATLIALYDIVFKVGEENQEITDGKFTVKIKLPTDFDITGKTIKAIYVNEDGEAEEIFAITDGEYATFEVTHFSVYGIVSVEPELPFVCPGHEDEDEDGKCDHCGETVTKPECPGHVDEDNDGKCDNCGETVEKGDEPGDEKPDEEKTNLTWLWILLAVIGVLIIVIIILLIIRKKKGDDGDDGAAAPETEPVAPDTDAAAEEKTASEEEPAAEELVAEEPVAEEPKAEEPVAEEPVAEEPVAEEPVAEEPVAEEPVAEEPVAEEPVAEEPVAEEPVAEEPKAEEPKAAPVIIPTAPVVDSEGKRLVNGEIVPVRYRTSFMSRLIQAEPAIQDYYTVVKNTLLSYKGVKARTSWNFESFNKGRIQCVKLNVKGNAFQVYLALDPNEYNVNKYHFTDVSDKPKLGDVPMLMKVKSDRTLKYSIELIDEVMKKNGIEQGEMPNVDYHMPYESTDALADRDLVKVILPAGMVIDENTIIEKVDVGALLKDVKDGASEEIEAPVAETVVEEPVAEEPVAEEPVVHIVDHHIAEEEIVHVDAVKADEIISDSQATEFIKTITHASGLKPKSNKHYEINLDTICENYEDGDIVTIESLKSKRLVLNKANRVKVLARGVMTKKLTVVADKFSIQAVKMIGLAGGSAEKYKD